MSFYNLFGNLVSVFEILFIIGCEYIWYKINGNYSDTIERLTNKLALKNVLYVKMFQAFALDNNMIDDEINNKLIKYTDQVPWEYSDINYADLIKVSGKYKLNLNSKNNKPINAGMISLVFKIDRVGGEESVIIKMKRKNIENKLRVSIEQILFIVYVLSYIPSLNKLHIYELIEKNIEYIREQTDFISEIENMEKMSKNCKRLKYVLVPKVYKEVTEEIPNIIMMEYIKGKKITELEEEERREYAKLVVKFGLVSYIMHGCTHGDLHSGNILFVNDEKDEKNKKKLGLLDFGIIYNYEDKFKNEICNIMMNIKNMEFKDIAKKSLEIILEPEGILDRLSEKDYNELIKISVEALDKSITKNNPDQYELFDYLSKMKEYFLKNKLLLDVKLKDDFVKSQMNLLMFHGVLMKLLGEDKNYELIDECLDEVFNRKLLKDD